MDAPSMADYALTCGFSKVELHTCARRGTSRIILSRIVAELESVPEHGMRAPVVIPDLCIWELSAELFCSIERVVDNEVINQTHFSNYLNMQAKQLSTLIVAWWY